MKLLPVSILLALLAGCSISPESVCTDAVEMDRVTENWCNKRNDVVSR